MCSTAPHDETLQVARFEARYGYKPDDLFYQNGIMFVGPAPDNEWEIDDEEF
jgi:hypothetical protein